MNFEIVHVLPRTSSDHLADTHFLPRTQYDHCIVDYRNENVVPIFVTRMSFRGRTGISFHRSASIILFPVFIMRMSIRGPIGALIVPSRIILRILIPISVMSMSFRGLLRIFITPLRVVPGLITILDILFLVFVPAVRTA